MGDRAGGKWQVEVRAGRKGGHKMAATHLFWGSKFGRHSLFDFSLPSANGLTDPERLYEDERRTGG